MSSLWHCWQRRVWRDVVGLDVLCLLLHPVARRRQVSQGVLAAVLQGKIKSLISRTLMRKNCQMAIGDKSNTS